MCCRIRLCDKFVLDMGVKIFLKINAWYLAWWTPRLDIDIKYTPINQEAIDRSIES